MPYMLLLRCAMLRECIPWKVRIALTLAFLPTPHPLQVQELNRDLRFTIDKLRAQVTAASPNAALLFSTVFCHLAPL
jgi:hypothetical protein